MLRVRLIMRRCCGYSAVWTGLEESVAVSSWRGWSPKSTYLLWLGPDGTARLTPFLNLVQMQPWVLQCILIFWRLQARLSYLSATLEVDTHQNHSACCLNCKHPCSRALRGVHASTRQHGAVSYFPITLYKSNFTTFAIRDYILFAACWLHLLSCVFNGSVLHNAINATLLNCVAFEYQSLIQMFRGTALFLDSDPEVGLSCYQHMPMNESPVSGY